MSTTTHPSIPGSIGAAIPRREDRRFITGAGRYVDDIVLPHQAYAVIVRSPHAYAEIRSITTTAALAAPGVLAVFTGHDVAADKVGGIPCGWLVKSKDGSNMVEPPHPMLVKDRVRHVGDQVAVVIAESKAEAR
ncbi:MAG: xanthine dehydrogenase family protein molybdopterin-binding subunit, partial [Deltaproteobacteria bacterium]|nr:xanthine dehydrogenase family protein molybdopterin-binding subunit [Deltaproteobacteria bacterium]